MTLNLFTSCLAQLRIHSRFSVSFKYASRKRTQRTHLCERQKSILHNFHQQKSTNGKGKVMKITTQLSTRSSGNLLYHLTQMSAVQKKWYNLTYLFINFIYIDNTMDLTVSSFRRSNRQLSLYTVISVA